MIIVIIIGIILAVVVFKLIMPLIGEMIGVIIGGVILLAGIALCIAFPPLFILLAIAGLFFFVNKKTKDE